MEIIGHLRGSTVKVISLLRKVHFTRGGEIEYSGVLKLRIFLDNTHLWLLLLLLLIWKYLNLNTCIIVFYCIINKAVIIFNESLSTSCRY